MRRHHNGICSGIGNFTKASIDTLVVNKTLVIGSVNLVNEVNELKKELSELREFISRLKLSDLKDVDTYGVQDGSSLGFVSDETKWVIFNEAGN